MSPTWRRAAKTPRRRPERLPGVTPPPSHTRAPRDPRSRVAAPAALAASRHEVLRRERGRRLTARAGADCILGRRTWRSRARSTRAPAPPRAALAASARGPVAARRGRRGSAPRSPSPARRSARSPDSVGLRRLGLGEPGQRRVVRVELGGHAERLVVDLRLAVARGGGASGMSGSSGVIGVSSMLSRATRSSAGAPHGCRTAGTSTEPSSRWPFSSSAITSRHGDRRAVERGRRGAARPSGGRKRMSSRRAWKSVVFEVEVSSRKRCCPAATPRSRTSWPPRCRGRRPRC